MRDKRSDGHVGVGLSAGTGVALNPPKDAPRRPSGRRFREPRHRSGGKVKGVEEVCGRTRSTASPAHEIERGSDAQRLLGVGLPQELALVAAVARGLEEEVVHALFNRLVADGLGRVPRVVGQTLRTGNASGGQVQINAVWNDAAVALELVREQALDASERDILEGRGSVRIAFAHDL